MRSQTRFRAVALTALAAAAVVAAIVGGAQIGRPDAAPPPTSPTATQTAAAPLPTGDAPRIPYINGTTLYVDGKAQPGNWSDVLTRGNGTTMATLNTAQRSGIIVLFREGAEVFRVARTNGDAAVLSEDGTKLAAVELDADTADLVVFDAVRGRELGRLAVDRTRFARDGEESEAWETLTEVGNDGTVSYGGVLVSHTWRPGDDPVDGDPAPYVDPFEGYPAKAEYVWTSPDGRWGAWLTDRLGNPPDDAHAQPLDGVTFQRRGVPDSRVTIALPEGTDASGGLRWESSTSVLVLVDGDTELGIWHFLRCDIAQLACERAPTPTAP